MSTPFIQEDKEATGLIEQRKREQMDQSDRHRALLYISEKELIWLIFCNQDRLKEQVENGSINYLRLPFMQNLPEDVKVCGAYYTPERAAFCFVLEHPSFLRTAEGCFYPEIRATHILAEISVHNVIER